MNDALPQPFLERLQRCCRKDQILSAAEHLLTYAYDGTAALKQRPAAVVLPETVEEVQALVRACAEAGVPIVSRGSGTGLSGGSVPSPGCVVLSLVRMDQIEEVDEANLTLLAQAGTLTQDIEQAATKAGLFYPPDPGSMKISTIGGNVANNSGGLRGLKYGVTRNYVMGMEVVLASGERVWLGNKCVKDVAGFSLRDLFIGSEGTLGIITRVLLRLLPQPADKRTLVATYASIEAAAQTVSDIIAAKIIPCTLEFLDQTTIICVDDFARIGLPRDAEAMLLMETDGHTPVVEDEAERMESIARKNGAKEVRKAANAEQAADLARARRSAFSALARVRPTTILEDVTVPRNVLAQMVRGVQDIAQRHTLRIANFGHMGDGNLHPTILTDERNAAEMERVEAAMDDIVALALDLGGTITGEHGVGIAKKRFLPLQFGDHSMALLRQVKASLDPQNLFSPGKIFDAE